MEDLQDSVGIQTRPIVAAHTDCGYTAPGYCMDLPLRSIRFLGCYAFEIEVGTSRAYHEVYLEH